MKLAIDRIVVSKDNPRQSFNEEDLRRLGESILSHGQLQPILVRQRGQNFELLVGERRLRASALVGLTTIDAEVREVDNVTALEFRLIENTQREDLTDAEKGDAVLSLWANYDKYKTIKEVANAIKVPYNTIITAWIPVSKKLSPNLKSVIAGDNSFSEEHGRELIKYPHTIQNKFADLILNKKIIRDQLRKIKKIYDVNPQRDLNEIADEVLGIETVTVPKSKLPKEVLEKIEDEKKQLAKVQKLKPKKKPCKPITKEDVLKKQEAKKRRNNKEKVSFKFKKVKVKEIKKKVLTPKLPEGVFDVIYADPPWKYDFSVDNRRSIDVHYSSMEQKDICALDIPAAENAILFLWATNPKLEQALEVIKAWGFTYKTGAVWDKEIIGMGYYWRNQHELLLTATKGNISPPLQENRRSSVITEKRTKHSKKPEQFYDIIEKMYPDGKYLELFQTHKREKWTGWGHKHESS